MSSPHQDSLLPRFAQGEEGHETTTKFPCLVCVDRKRKLTAVCSH